MLGLVNRGVEDLARKLGGHELWERIAQGAGLTDDPSFSQLESYPDDVTARLVESASRCLGLSPDQVLEAFGEHWILYTAEGAYGHLLRGPKTFPEFLQRLDDLHARLGLLMPQLQPPSFHCTEVTQNGLRLHYSSRRPGLHPMVVGLLRGLGKRFQLEVEVVGQGFQEGAYVFSLSWKAAHVPLSA